MAKAFIAGAAFIMGILVPWALSAIQGVMSTVGPTLGAIASNPVGWAAANPMTAGGTIGAVRGGIEDGWEGALRGGVLGAAGGGLGGAVGSALGRLGGAIGAPTGSGIGQAAGAITSANPLASGLTSGLTQGVAQGATSLAPAAIGAATGGALSAPGVDELVVSATRPTAEGAAGASAASTAASETPATKNDGNSYGQKTADQIGKEVVSQALNRLTAPNVAAPPTAPASNASPFMGAGGGATPPSGIAVRGSTAPNIYPWRQAARPGP